MRIIIDEGTAGFWADADLYKLLDSGQNEIIDYCIRVEAIKRLLDNSYTHPELEPLMVTALQNLVSGTDVYTFSGFSVSNYRTIYQVRIKYTSTFYPATKVSKRELDRRAVNTYATATQSDPIYNVEATQIVIAPSPTGNVTNGISMVYYKNPSTVASGQDFTLRATCHEAIVDYAAWKALEKDGEYQEAALHAQKFNQFLSQL